MKFRGNKTLKVGILSSLVTAIIFSGIGVVALSLSAKDIGFTSKNNNWQVDNVEDAVDDLYKIGEYVIAPDTYFYDPTTLESEVVRYKKVDGKYYLCDEHGNVTNDVVQDITSLSLVEYKMATSDNLSSGTAGFASEKLFLGNGVDNLDFKEEGKVEIKKIENTLSWSGNVSGSSSSNPVATKTISVNIGANKTLVGVYMRQTNFNTQYTTSTTDGNGLIDFKSSYDSSTGVVTITARLIVYTQYVVMTGFSIPYTIVYY